MQNNDVDMQHNNLNVWKYNSTMRLKLCLMLSNINKLHIDKNKSHVNIVML